MAEQGLKWRDSDMRRAEPGDLQWSQDSGVVHWRRVELASP